MYKMQSYHFSQRQLSNEVAALPVVSPLVLEPLAVALDASNLLAVVIGDGVGDRVGRGIDTESANAIEELLLFLRYIDFFSDH